MAVNVYSIVLILIQNLIAEVPGHLLEYDTNANLHILYLNCDW